MPRRVPQSLPAPEAGVTLPSLSALLASLGPSPPRIISAETDSRRQAHTARYREAASQIKKLEAAWSPILTTRQRELDDSRLALRPDLADQVRTARALAHDIPRLWANAIYLEGKAMELEALGEDAVSEETVVRDAIHAVGTVEAIQGQLARLAAMLTAILAAAEPSRRGAALAATPHNGQAHA